MKRVLLFVVLLFVLAAPVLAQEELLIRFVISPATSQTVNGTTYLFVNHFWTHGHSGDTELQGVTYSSAAFGSTPVYIVSANVNQTQSDYLDTLTDIVAWPLNIDTKLTAQQVSDFGTRLETMNIPSQWMTTADSSRTAMREVYGYFSFIQEYSGYTNIDLSQNVSLSTTVGSVALAQWAAMKNRWGVLQGTINPATNPERLYDKFEAFQVLKSESIAAGLSQLNFYKAALIIIASDMGYDVSAIVAGTTLRQIYRGLAAQNDLKVFQINGVLL